MIQLSLPVARISDPSTSREAAARAGKTSAELEDLIYRIALVSGPLSAFEMVDEVERRAPGRWRESTIRSAVSRVLVLSAVETTNRWGSRCKLYSIDDQGGVL